MIVWRLCRAPFADLTGAGARLNGGRWNSRGSAIVYAAEAAALCVLELRLHLDLPPDLLPDDYVLMAIDIGDVTLETLDRLPTDPRSIGDRWLRERRTAGLRVQSFILPESCNVLLNPAHPDAATLAVRKIRPFRFGERQWSAS